MAIVYSDAILSAGDRMPAGSHRQARDVARRRQLRASTRCPVSRYTSRDASAVPRNPGIFAASPGRGWAAADEARTCRRASRLPMPDLRKTSVLQ
ncbi:hypothetical protein DIE23_16455 [Burkholderia sp. Bp9143]|nr:hypothetical protein DIE23_16455 [Burkholderia sp. Bp9143]